jgi:hypothetical protein
LLRLVVDGGGRQRKVKILAGQDCPCAVRR